MYTHTHTLADYPLPTQGGVQPCPIQTPVALTDRILSDRTNREQIAQNKPGTSSIGPMVLTYRLALGYR